MKVLFVAATQPEITASIPLFEAYEIDYLITGVGMLATTYALTKHLQKKEYDLVINVGIGGILDPKATLGTVYQIQNDKIFQFGAEDNDAFISIETLGFGTSVYPQVLPRKNLTLPSVPAAEGITVNKVHGRRESIQQLQSDYPTGNVVESMEGVAVFFVSNNEGIPVLQFRAVSNYIEPRNRAAWQIRSAVSNLNTFIKEIVINIR
ncbi:futalosine hydrolase [Sphingobacterium psychroaquaticum]|uniref:futalosine hydrolase n=1 Tax=Sphingobacterium psychroaquaticum TaxID=561061 RepID=UPI00106C350A|nr:futalosine hydrolase [Sphingobacterium psychroaquaticum]QBQ42917.1 futalosine hydrolase [Sphingobacterium psychroaquaticum]